MKPRRNICVDKLHVVPTRTQKWVCTEGVDQTQPIMLRPVMVQFMLALFEEFMFPWLLMLVITSCIDSK